MSRIHFEEDFLFGVVGTRQPTLYGQQVCESIAADLAASDAVIVSGLALGIDTIAHRAAIDAGRKTIAVMGCGVDIAYPQQNSRIYEKIIEESGIVVSEFPPGMVTMKGLFVARNRLISGLSRGVLVVEGSARSGSLITARYAAEQGKDVFAIPAPLMSDMSAAPLILLKEGATLATSAEDILSSYGLTASSTKLTVVASDFTQEELSIFKHMKQPVTIDEVVEKCELPTAVVLRIISLFELRGLAQKCDGLRYVAKYVLQ